MPVIRVVDKLDKIGREGVLTQLQEQVDLSKDLAERCLALCDICTPDLSFGERVRDLGVMRMLSRSSNVIGMFSIAALSGSS